MKNTAIIAHQAAVSLVIERLLSTQTVTKCPLVLLHGWGCDSQIWQGFAQLLANSQKDRDIWLVNLPGFGGSTLPEEVNLKTILNLLADTLPAKVVIMGWSLGGMIATAYASNWPGRVEALVCLGTNASYVQREHWQQAIPKENLELFVSQLVETPQRCIKRFRANQVRNDRQEKALLQQLMQQQPGPVDNAWFDMLELLAQIDNRKALQNLQVNTLYLFGEHDSLVPQAAAEHIAVLNNHINIEVFRGVAHVLHLAEPEKITASINAFLNKAKAARDKRQVALSFSRSAGSYDNVAHLQRATGNQLVKLLPEISASCPHILDLGCGTGHFKGVLAEKFPEAHIMGLDLAEGMLRFAKNKLGGHQWCCGDAEQLPIASNTIDLLFSNLSIQWCDNLDAVASEIYRTLKPGGCAVISTLGSNTLCELREAWLAVDQMVHVNNFLPVKKLPEVFCHHPFDVVEHQVELRVARYEDALGLFRELKALGAHNVNQGRPVALTGKGRFKRLSTAYEKFRSLTDDKLPATWEVVYLILRK